MKIVVAPDKFRGSLQADEVGAAMAAGIFAAFPAAEVHVIPLADGGEGTAKALTMRAQGTFLSLPVRDPLGRPIQASYGISADQKTAFIEMAVASGLHLLTTAERDPTQTSSYGTGQLIADALDRGAKSIILGIGGSATNDGGMGMAEALGFRFLDQVGHTLPAKGDSLARIHTIDASMVHKALAGTTIRVACDVTNPLCGEEGATAIYGPQKGATQAQVLALEAGMQNLATIATRTFGKDVRQVPGAGAAGGVGAGAMWFLNAKLEPGATIVLEQTRFEQHLRGADLVITGEGKMDRQTLSGKLILRVAEMCGRHQVPIAAVCGTLDIEPEESARAGITYAVSALNRPLSLQQAQDEAFSLVRQATFHLVRLFFWGK